MTRKMFVGVTLEDAYDFIVGEVTSYCKDIRDQGFNDSVELCAGLIASYLLYHTRRGIVAEDDTPYQETLESALLHFVANSYSIFNEETAQEHVVRKVKENLNS